MITEISKAELEKILSEKEYTSIVDIREKEEFLDYNIGGINIPAHEITSRISELEPFLNLLVVCSNGTRSSIMARVLQKKLPYTNIFHLSEGIF